MTENYSFAGIRPLWLWIAAAWLLMTGCVSGPYQGADVVIPDAHGGGSSLAISEDSSSLVSGSWSGRISVWRLPDGNRQRGWRGHKGDVTGLAVLDGGRILSAGYDGALNEWSFQGEKTGMVQTGSPITAMTTDSSRNWVVTGHVDGSLRLWSSKDLSPVQVLGGHDGAIRAVAIDPGAARFASSATDGKVKIWLLDGSVRILPESWSDARTLVFSPQENYLIGAGWFDLYRWDLQRGGLATLDTEHNGIINSILFHPKQNYLASISRQTDSSVLFLDPQSGSTVNRFQSHKLCGGTVVISPDGQIMATTSDDASLMIWNLDGTGSQATETTAM